MQLVTHIPSGPPRFALHYIWDTANVYCLSRCPYYRLQRIIIIVITSTLQRLVWAQLQRHLNYSAWLAHTCANPSQARNGLRNTNVERVAFITTRTGCSNRSCHTSALFPYLSSVDTFVKDTHEHSLPAAGLIQYAWQSSGIAEKGQNGGRVVVRRNTYIHSVTAAIF